MATAQYSDACEAYNRAVNLNSNDPQVWCSLGVLYYAFGQYREALGMLTRALKLDCTMADAWYNVGALYDMCDQPEDAQQAYLKAKEHGLADRFAKAGMGLNPIASQAMQVISSSSSSEAFRPPQTGSSVAAPVSSSSSGPFRQHPSEHQPQHQNDQQHLQQQMDLHKQLQLQQQVMQQQMIQHHQQLSLQPLFPEHGMQHYQQPQYQQPQYHQHVPGAVPIHLQESQQQQLIEDLQTINYSELSRDGDLPEHDAHF
jgi:tetratricopeptide (TPR) repeat protein